MIEFYDTIKDLDWQQVTQSIEEKTEKDVETALSKTFLDIEDFKALISPSADKYLETMAQMSRDITQRRFGKVMLLYIPMYLSNECSNHCIYCGFNHNNPIARKTLTDEEINQEIKVIKQMGYDNVLLLTGEYPRKVGEDYIAHAIELCKKHFSTINLEVYPMKVEQYKRMAELGCNTVYVYQETYNEKRYKVYHPKGMKSNYHWRLNTPERIAQAGMHKVGMGALIGLEQWRTEMVYLAMHLRFMTKNYWRTKYAVSFPRMRPAAGGYQPNFLMSERQFAQALWSFRIFDNDVEICMSTRETKNMRDHFITLGITSISAGSHTEPGGYAHPQESLEQFHINDDRTPEQMEQMIRSQGYDVIYKDWDRSLE